MISSNTLSEQERIESLQGQRDFGLGFLRVTEIEMRKGQCVSLVLLPAHSRPPYVTQ